MGLRFDPVGGGQFKQAIKTIIEAESQPVKQLETRKAREEQKLKLFQEFKGKFSAVDKALAEISTFSKFRELKADLGDGNNYFGVTIDKEKAQPGSYQLEIDQIAQRSSVISNGFENPDDPVMGIGFVVMNLGNGESAEVYVDDDESSLHGIANLINKESRSPVRAAVIRDASDAEAPWKLILTAKKEGQENSVQFPDFYFLDGSKDFYIDDNHEAKNAQVQVDGFPIEMTTNDIADFLPGVNLHLKGARPDQPFTLTISEDTQKMSGKIKELINQINGVLQFITQQNTVDEHTDTRTTFAGDTSLQAIEYRLRNLMHEGFPFGDPEEDGFRLVFMNELGIEFDKTGQLTFKEDKFNKKLEKDFEGVSEAVTGGFGFAYQMRELISSYTRGGTGLLATREQGMRASIKDMDSQIDQRMRILDRRQQSLTEQFSRLEASLGDLQRQQQYLAATLPGAGGGGGNIVAQLLGQ